MIVILNNKKNTRNKSSVNTNGKNKGGKQNKHKKNKNNENLINNLYDIDTNIKLSAFNSKLENSDLDLCETYSINKDYSNDRINMKLLLRKSNITKKLFNLKLENK